MANNNQNQKIYFPEANETIMKILEKNNLKETLEEAIKKIEQKKDCRINIIYNISRDFAEGNILEKDFIAQVQKQMETSAQIAENLVKDIKEKLLPLGIKVDIEEPKKTETEMTTVKPARLINKTQDINKKENTELSQTVKKSPAIEKKERKIIEETPENKETKRKSRKQDSYLEPIE